MLTNFFLKITPLSVEERILVGVFFFKKKGGGGLKGRQIVLVFFVANDVNRTIKHTLYIYTVAEVRCLKGALIEILFLISNT